MKNTLPIIAVALIIMPACLFAEGQGAASLQESSASAPEAQSGKQTGKPRLSPEKREELKRNMEIRRGGPKIARPGTLKGKIAVVNSQSAADNAWIEDAVEYLRKETNFSIELHNGEFTFPKPKVVGDSTLYVIDDPSMPRVLVASEDRWSMMNVAPLKNSKPAFFEARVKKEVSRAFAMLCGGMSSAYGISLVGPVTKSEDLDIFPNGKLPIDIVMRMEPYMSGLGVVPAKLVPYRVACEEGWAPAPTNDVQKAIWEKVHAVPATPMKIEFDSKKGR